MQISDRFRVSTPITTTWDTLLDVERIAPCLPGAQLQEIDGDEYRGVVKVKVGPITAQYKGAARLVEVDEAARRIVIEASGRETRGQGNASARVVVVMEEDGAGTDVAVDTELTITGRVAQFGRGVLADVSAKLLGQFVENLERDVISSGEGEGAVAAGEQAGREVAETPAGRGATAEPAGPRRVDAPEAEPIDLLGVAGRPLAQRVVPLALGALLVLVLWRLLRPRR